jgi:FkbM family methyltransferase
MKFSNNINNGMNLFKLRSRSKSKIKIILYFIASKIRFKILFMILKAIISGRNSGKMRQSLLHFFDPNQIRRLGKWKIRSVKVQHINDGIKLNLDLSEHIDYVTYLNGSFDDLYKKLIRKLINTSGSTWNFIDVGANLGSVAISIGKEVNVLAFEPQADLFKRLVNHSKINNCINMKIENFALTSEKIFQEFGGVRNLYKPQGNSGAASFQEFWNPSFSSPTVISAKLTTLDRYCKDKSVFEDHNNTILKIDVEGGELDVIQGASNFISQHKPIIILEYRTDLLKENSKILMKHLESLSGYYIKKIWLDKVRGEVMLDDLHLNLASCNLALIPEEKKLYLKSSWHK